MKKRWVRIIGIIAIILVLIDVLSYFADEPLRRYVEREMNSRLKGYSVLIETLRAHPFAFSVDLGNIIVRQKANPEPPIAEIRKIHGGVRWRDFFIGHIVGDAEIDKPKLYINVKNLTAEIKKPPAKKEAWQDTIEAIFPLKINEFRIKNGEATYVEAAHSKPLQISGVTIVARNVKNVKSPERVYPSQVFLEAVLPGSARIRVNGDADFLLKPFLGIRADFVVEGMDLTAFREKMKLSGINLSKGTIAASGNFEFSPKTKRLDVKDVTIRNPEIDYIYIPQPEKKKPPVKKPEFPIKAQTIRIINGNIGIVNKTTDPSYRVFVSDLDLEIRNFSNQFTQGPAELFLKGKFMGTGETVASGTFRPEKPTPDFKIRIAIKNTQIKDMNNLFRAYGNFDVSHGLFSFYSELTVKNDTVTGYVKPLFRDMKVYDKRKDEEKGAFRKLYEQIVGGVAKLLENPRKAVATETPVTGKLEKAHISTWDAIVNIFQNAFFHSILPGFEKNIK